eukprot:TRINITY_DN92987_c0_g1_i1.p1 TRINITY_DN92987_c0_g1~~TRINITY_DN92987_c0_g1_i1.p1  ORF type:complete len:380 (+),score=58.37 TRINITY_DN92987_c0_g1_i1:72-1211(+)
MIGFATGFVVSQTSAFLCTAGVFFGISYAYRPHGVAGIAAITTQIAAIAAVQLSTKYVLQSGFSFPMTITTIHFAFVTLFCVIWSTYQALQGNKDLMWRMLESRAEYGKSAAFYARRFASPGLLQTANVVLNTVSLAYIGAGLNALIGIMTPLSTALVAYAFGAPISSVGWTGIVVAILGDAIISTGGLTPMAAEGTGFSMAFIGITLAVGALLARSTRTVLLECQMTPFPGDQDCPKLGPIEVVVMICPVMLFTACMISISLEGLAPFQLLLTLEPMTAAMFLLSIASALYLTFMGVHIVKMLGASAAQIAGKLNVLVTVALSSAFLGEEMTSQFIMGAVLVLAGAATFEFGQEAMARQAEMLKMHDQKADKASYGAA